MECIIRWTRARQHRDETSDVFSIVGQIAPEIRQWLQETFDLQQEVLTTALTLSTIFPHPPRVVGAEWGPEWQVQVDDFHRLLPEDRVPGWKYRSLVVLDEVGPHCLSRVWPRIEATARDKIVVVVLQPAAGTETGEAPTTSVLSGQVCAQ